MPNVETLLVNGSPDTLKTAHSTEQRQARPDLLPRGSELSLKTIERLVGQIKQAAHVDDVQQPADAILVEVSSLLAQIQKRKQLLAG